MAENNSLRSTFNNAASDFDAVRPGYPEQVYEDIIALSGIPEGGRALEVGCGTGQATFPFAQRGYHILCLDIGPDLTAIAREKMRAYPKVHFELTSFENWPLQPGEYDLVYSATAFHWIPPEIGYPKAAQALKPGGSLAIFINLHPRPLTGFFLEVQSIYRKYMPGLGDARERPTTEAEIQAQAEYIRATALFNPVIVRTYPWSKTYATTEYLRLLNTYSDHQAIEERRRLALYKAIAILIEERYNGKVERPYLSVLYLGRKV